MSLLRIYAPGRQPSCAPSGLTVAPGWQWRDEGIEYDRYYPLDDDHKFIVRKIDDRNVIIEIKQGKRRVQQAIVKPLSFVSGYDSLGQTVITPHIFELHPDRPIYPLEQLVDQLLVEGVEGYKITREIDPLGNHSLSGLSGAAVLYSYAEPYMESDGNVSSRPSSDLYGYGSGLEFSVNGATWVIQATKDGIHHIYLWDEAADSASDILEAVRKIQAKTLADRVA